LKRNFIWRYANKKVGIPLVYVRDLVTFCPLPHDAAATAAPLPLYIFLSADNGELRPNNFTCTLGRLEYPRILAWSWSNESVRRRREGVTIM
jgi:hypothetical protein